MAGPEFGSMKIGDEEVAFSPIPLPIIYFDNAPSLSHLNGVIGITLVVTGNVPGPNETVGKIASVVAHLKCNIPAALALKSAIESALLLAQPAAETPTGKAN
jgi:hypothetical protein